MNKYLAMVRPSKPQFQVTKWLMMSTLIGATAIMSGCANKVSQNGVGAIPDDYRTRHPIMIANRDSVVDLPVPSTSSHLTVQMKEIVQGVAQNYRSSGSGLLSIMRPVGSANSSNASNYAQNIKQSLISYGVPAGQVVIVPYESENAGGASPIRLSYSAIAAFTQPCGQWTEDMLSGSYNNKNYKNFGCASQSNLAAQIANPADLLAPRGQSPVDAQHRSNVIEKYQSGR